MNNEYVNTEPVSATWEAIKHTKKLSEYKDECKKSKKTLITIQRFHLRALSDGIGLEAIDVLSFL